VRFRNPHGSVSDSLSYYRDFDPIERGTSLAGREALKYPAEVAGLTYRISENPDRFARFKSERDDMTKLMLGIFALFSISGLSARSASARPVDMAPFNVDNTGYTRTPFGRVHSSCVHRMPRGAHVRNGTIVAKDGTVLLTYGQCPFPILDRRTHESNSKIVGDDGRLAGLLGYVESRNADVIESTSEQWFFNGMEANLVVPAAPSSPTTSELVFLFPSFENTAPATAIIQPVLQYGASAAGGANETYGIAPWYIDSLNNVNTGEVETVNPGDTLDMYMFADTCTSDGICDWQAEIDDWTIDPPVSSYIGVEAIDSFVQVFSAALEAYSVTACNQLPNSGGVTFSDEYFYEPGNDSGYFYYQDVTSSLSWGSRYTGSGTIPLCAWGQSGPSSHSSTLSW
jgi:hypothetical protein